MKNSFVTVVLPCHGSLPYIKETVYSLIHQSFSDFEVIVVNDRIAGEYLEYIHGLHKTDSRFKVVESHGHGISAALNTGIDLSKSNLIARIDSDDIMDRQRLEFQLDRISTNLEVLCVGSQLKVIDEKGILKRLTNYPESSDQIRKMMQIRNVVAHPSVIFRRDAILSVGAYRSFFDGSEDYDLWLRLIKSGEIINMHESLTSYRIHSSQETQKNRKNQLEMDSMTRIYAIGAFPIPELGNGHNLKSMVGEANLSSVDYLAKTTLPHPVKVSLSSAYYLNAAMSRPTFTSLIRSVYVLYSRPKLFLLALKYSFSRWLNV